MNEILLGIILSFTPIFEMQAGIPLLYHGGIPLWWAFIISIAFNTLAFPITYLFLNYLHKHFLKFRKYEQLFQHFEERYKRKIEHKIGTAWEYWTLLIFVMLPGPGTGAYAGSFLSWLFKLNKKKSFFAITLGMIINGLLVLLITYGVVIIF
ncbi:MAG TPA: small multi-drug export protein [Candidatus Nanoarchaeia archaeon]|nr:small multi-drug export protein [Candidatus Nanoarchaeia archaeon]